MASATQCHDWITSLQQLLISHSAKSLSCWTGFIAFDCCQWTTLNSLPCSWAQFEATFLCDPDHEPDVLGQVKLPSGANGQQQRCHWDLLWYVTIKYFQNKLLVPGLDCRVYEQSGVKLPFQGWASLNTLGFMFSLDCTCHVFILLQDDQLLHPDFPLR